MSKERVMSPEKETFVLSCAYFLTMIGGAVTANALMFTNPITLIPVAVLAVGAGFFGYGLGRDI